MAVLMHRADRRLVKVLIALVLVGGLLPFGAVAGAQEDDGVPGTPVTMTFTTVEILEAGSEWTGADGTFHLRDELELNTVSGDIEGSGTVNVNGDFVITGECNEQFCEGQFHGWVNIDVDGDAGGWTGNAGFVSVEGGGYIEFRGMLVGDGANAGKVIYIDTFVEETETAITLSGHLIERGARPSGISIRYDGCFTGFEGTGGTVAGGFILHGPHDDSGALSASFSALGTPTPGIVYGDMTFTGSHGTLYGTFVEASIGGGADFGLGTFVLTGGTGAYEGVYGYGKVIERAAFGEAGMCDGPKGYWIGETFSS